MRCSLLCTICADTSIQPHLPQVLLTNGKIFGRKPAIPHLKGNLIMWTQKSAWASQATLRRYVSLLGSRLQHVAPGRDYSLLLDCAPCHLHDSIKNQAKMCRIRLLYIAAGLTRLLQPADVSVVWAIEAEACRIVFGQESRQCHWKDTSAGMAGCSRVNFADSLTGCQMEPCLSKGRSVEWPDRCAVIGFCRSWVVCPTCNSRRAPN